MPLTLDEFNATPLAQLKQRYGIDEIRSFAMSLGFAPTPPTPPPADEGFGNRGDFFSVSPDNPDADLFSAETLGRTLGNVPGSALNVAKDTFNAVTNPIDTVGGLIEAGPSGLLSALGERFGSPEALRKTFVEDPAGLALDASPIGGAIGGIAKAGKLGGTAARVAQTASALNPATALVKGAAKVGNTAGKVVGTGLREAAAVASGKDSGVFTTGRRALAPDMGDLTETFSRGGTVPQDVASQGARNFAKEQRSAFTDATKNRNVDAIPEAAAKVEEAIGTELNRIAEDGKAQFSNVPVDRAAYGGFTKKLIASLRDDFGVVLTPDGVDISRTSFRHDAGAAGRIQNSLTDALEPLRGNPTVGDVWLARRRIDEAHSTALAQKFGNTEQTILKRIRGDLNDFLGEVDDPSFKKFNEDFSAGAQLRERFAREITGAGAAGKSPEAQISAVVRSIKDGRASSEAFLTRVEAQTGIPLRAIAAGKELSDIVPSGLIGRGLFAGAVFAGTGFNPGTLLIMLGTSPILLSKVMRGSAVAERQIQKAVAFADGIMSIPGAKELAEQGVTLGAMIQQLVGPFQESEQPSVLGAIGNARQSMSDRRQNTFGTPSAPGGIFGAPQR